MGTFRFKITIVVALLFLASCASQQELTDPPTKVEESAQVLQQPAPDESVLVQQDMGFVTLNERNEFENLKNLEIEGAETSRNLSQDAEVSAAEVEVEAAPQALPTLSKHKKTYTQAEQNKEEMTQLLFEADTLVIQKGDSLSLIAEKHLGSLKAWRKIWALNPSILDPDTIEVGAKIFIPKNNYASTKSQAPKNSAPVVAPVATPVSTPVAAPVVTPVVAPVVTPVVAPVVTPVVAPVLVPDAEPLQANEAPTIDQLYKEKSAMHQNMKSQDQASESVERKIASTEAKNEEPEAQKIAPAKGLPRLVSYLGILLFIAVLGGFFLSKPQKDA